MAIGEGKGGGSLPSPDLKRKTCGTVPIHSSKLIVAVQHSYISIILYNRLVKKIYLCSNENV